MKKTDRKLTLNKQTIRKLDGIALSSVRGASDLLGSMVACATVTCDTVCQQATCLCSGTTGGGYPKFPKF